MKQQINISEFRDLILKGNLEGVKDFVLKGADINTIDEYMIPMFVHAIDSRNKEIVDFFFKSGAEVNPKHERVMITPLGAAVAVASMAASIEETDYTFGRLLHAGANPNPTNATVTPLHRIIVVNGPQSSAMLRTLVTNWGANINPEMDDVTSPLTLATSIACQTTTGLDLFNTCINLGAKINPTNSSQASPLIGAIPYNSKVADIIIKYLVEKGAALESEVLHNSPLYQAIVSGKKDMCEFFIGKGANLSKIIGDVNLSASAIRSGNLDMLQYLVDKGMELCWDKALEISLDNWQPSGIEMTKFLLLEAENRGCLYDKRELLVKAVNNQNEIISNFLIEKFDSVDLSDYQGHFNFSTPWSMDIAIKLNHPLSAILKTATSGNIDEVFQAIETIIKNPSINKGNVTQALECIKKEKAQELVQKILKDTRGDGAKAIKTLALFQLKHTFKNDKFVLTTTTQGNEAWEMNTFDIKEKSKTYIKGGKICFSYSQETVSDGEGYIYVVSKKGDLYLNTTKNFEGLHHSFFLKGKPGQENYGYGKPVACGGHITLKDGLIAKIDSHSGHYSPNLDQLKLVCKHFKDSGMLAKDVVIETYDHSVKIDSDFLDSIVIGDILAQYPDLAGG